ncbi:helix-turn-helix domain-containing protein [Pseudescherichia sp.]|uniref:helix-turn-helix domain-containing protein n=1 Tax=Pseudescherichia sp. TaxID=2055881 RepID=UPI00289773FF|nr:helix-turn-helix domain-containing protein [Pseudescherichia sp.]
MKTHLTDNDVFEHYFSFAVQSKPIKAIEKIFSHLLPYGKKIQLKKGKHYRINEEDEGVGLLLITDGLVSFINTDTGHFISTLYPPTIIGLSHGYNAFYNVPDSLRSTLYAETDADLIFIPLQTFIDTVDKQNLWHDVARILAHRIVTLMNKEKTYIGVDSYSIIKSMIQEVWLYPDHYRLQISLPKFIQNRSGLSRSRIMKILFDLKLGGYVNIVNGKLLSVSKLPTSY